VSGFVRIVGAGPGDPGLITVAGRAALETAEVVLYDALANAALLSHVSVDAECILVGKRHGRSAVAQSEIERLIIEHASAGRRVVRLKGGDPFMFGRGGEEAAACRRAGIDFDVIPGVTSAVAVPAYAGIPVTHRGHASMVTVVTGRPGVDNPDGEPDWAALGRLGGTLVLVMAMTRMQEICEALVRGGMPTSTPAAAIRWGTLPRQRKVIADVGTIAARAQESLHRPPVVFVIGAVAGLAEELAWFEKRPLFGRRILVTRARHQASKLSERLEALGAEVIAVPTIETAALPIAPDGFDRATQANWLIFTSTNGVELFFAAWRAQGRDLRELAGVRIAAIGPATEAAVANLGLRVEARPDEYRAEALLEELGDVAGLRVMVARARVAREILPDELRRRGAQVEVLPVYETRVPKNSIDDEALDSVDLITFTSSSTALNFQEVLGEKADKLVAGAGIAAIGPITAATLAEKVRAPDVIATEYTIPGLVDAVLEYFANREPAA
jgi:uroporphyrinogen III methyltransferase/synthase